MLMYLYQVEVFDLVHVFTQLNLSWILQSVDKNCFLFLV